MGDKWGATVLMTSDGKTFVFGLFGADGYECENLEGLFATETAATHRKEWLQSAENVEYTPHPTRPHKYSRHCYGNPDLLEIRMIEIVAS